MRSLGKLTTVSMVGALSLVLATACGDDDDDGGTVDARTIDTSVPAVDADTTPDAMPAPARAGTIAIIEAAVTNANAAPLGGLHGASVTVSFSDALTGTAPVTGFESPVNGCLVRVYDLENGDVTATAVDEGIVTVSGTSNGTFACAFNATLMEYVCANPAAGFSGTIPATSSATNINPSAGAVVLTLSGADFSTIGPQLRGTYVVISDWNAGDDAGAGSVVNGTFPVLGAGSSAGLADNQMLIVNPLVSTTPMVNTNAAATYATVVGANVIPGGTIGAFDNFLDHGEPGDGDGGVGGIDYSINLAASPSGCTAGTDCRVEAISVTQKANGASSTGTNAAGHFKLDSTSAQPHDMCPGATMSDISSCSAAKTFSCHKDSGTDAGADGNCGEGSHGVLKVLAVSGSTTDAVLPTTGSPLDFAEMPDPVKKYATWQCSFVGGASTGGTIPAGAMAAIMGTNPTRIFTQVLHVGGGILQNDPGNPNKSTTNVLIGHGVAGFTDVPGAVGQTP